MPIHAKNSKARAAAIKAGYNSGLEEVVANQLKDAAIPFGYEKLVLPYIEPESKHKYTPDFILMNGIIVETKGRFVTADRQKMRLIRAQYPDLDIRFVFQNPRARISKISATTYQQWCERYGFPHVAKGTIPVSWLTEPINHRSLEVIETLVTQWPWS